MLTRILFLLFMCVSVFAKTPTIKLAPLPMASATKTVKIFSPFARHVSSILGKKVDIVNFIDYGSILRALRQNHIDLAYLGPLPYATYTLKRNNIAPLVGFFEKNGKKGYRCVLIASKLDDVRPKIIKDKKVALTQPLSTCGFFMTQKLLRKYANISINDMRFAYLKKHTNVAINVLRGNFLLGGVKDSIANDYKSLGLVVLEKSDLLPSFILVANTNTLNKETIELLRHRLLLTPKEVFSRWGSKISHGMFGINPSDFDIIKKTLKNMHIPQKGNI